ncbi:MAG: phage portal protein [Paracoccaceae bacterium]|nr:phage portal protein [Paracoccaceae bacterium]
MGFFDRFKRTEKRAVSSLTGGDSSNPYLDGWNATGGVTSIEGHPNVISCVDAIAGTIATLPMAIKRREPDGRLVEAPDHPLNDVIRDGPNERQSMADFVEAVLSDTLLRGNGVARIEIEAQTGRAVGLEFVPWRNVSLSQTQSGRLVLDYTPASIGGAAPTPQRRLMPGEYLHVMDSSSDGILGRSRLNRAALSAANAANLDAHLAAMIANGGGRPGSLLEVPQSINLDDQGVNRLREGIERFRSMQGRGRTMVLDEGITFKEIEAFSPSDFELVEGLKFQTVAIARLFGVPPVMIGALENASYSNAGQLQRFFAQGTLSHWVAKFEAAFNRAVFTAEERAEYALDISLDGLLRGDPETRWAAHKIAAEIGAADPATIARLEGLPTPTERPREPEPVAPPRSRSASGEIV